MNTSKTSLQKSLNELKQYRKEKLEPKLKSFHEKNAHIKQVYEYCTTSYNNAKGARDKKRIEKETMEYVEDLTKVMNQEIEVTSECILNYLDMTVDLTSRMDDDDV